MGPRHWITTLGSAAAMLLLAGCASQAIEPASEELGGARSALESARSNDADDYAPVLFQQAQNKVQRAEREIREGDPLIGTRLAHEATLDARLASLRADLARTERLVGEIESGIDDLEAEIAGQ